MESLDLIQHTSLVQGRNSLPIVEAFYTLHTPRATRATESFFGGNTTHICIYFGIGNPAATERTPPPPSHKKSKLDTTLKSIESTVVAKPLSACLSLLWDTPPHNVGQSYIQKVSTSMADITANHAACARREMQKQKSTSSSRMPPDLFLTPEPPPPPAPPARPKFFLR